MKKDIKNVKKEFVRFYTPDTIGLIGDVFYGPGWYEFIKYTYFGENIIPMQLNIDGYTIYYENGLIPNMEAPKEKLIYGKPIRWWSIEHIRESKLEEFLNGTCTI